MENQCAVCQVPAGLRCGACKQVAYCCKEHQKEHWKTHKTICRSNTSTGQSQQTSSKKVEDRTSGDKMNEMLKLMQSLSANSGGLGGAGAAPGVASHMPSSMHPSNNAWSRGFKSQDEMYEWLVDCYRMRLDDDYAWGGCFLHGLYDQENTKQDIVADFLVFAKLAVRHDCLPSTGWNWERFLQKAKSLIPYAFEKSDAKEKYGGENVFSAFTGGRSLRSTGEIIFNSSVTSHWNVGDSCSCGQRSRESLPGTQSLCK